MQKETSFTVEWLMTLVHMMTEGRNLSLSLIHGRYSQIQMADLQILHFYISRAIPKLKRGHM